ncbi:MAG: RHS repeat-associated core domain-containing protein, partial [Bacteroidota bacterium]
SVSSVVQNYSSNDLLTNHTYDDNGNTTSSPVTDYASIIHDGIPATGTISDVYDFRNKLIRRSFVGGKTILLSYDADGNRVSKQVLDTASATFSEREHHYLVDTNNHTGYAQVAEERDIDGFLTRVNRYGHDLVATDYITEGYQRYYQYDGLGSVRALSDENGDVTDEYTFDAFGILIDSTGNTPNNNLYAGEQWDSDLGMYYNRARYLNTQTGRFHSMDTYEGRNGEPMTLHKYLYAHANPVSGTDPSGNFLLAQQAAAINLAYRVTVAFPLATGILKTSLSVLTVVTFMNDPAAFIGAFNSPSAAANILALEANFAVGVVVRTGQLIRGGFNAGLVSVQTQASLQQASAALKKIDPNAFIGIRGSVARGFKGSHKGNDPFDVTEFDIDAFIVSDKIKTVPVEVQNAAKAAAIQIRKSYPGLKEEINFFTHTHRQYQNSARFNSPDNPNFTVD